MKADDSLADLSNVSPRDILSTISDHVYGTSCPSLYEEEINAAAPLPERKQPLDTLRVEESTEARLERLGRQRPDVFASIWSEIGFVFSISMSQILSVSFSFNVLSPPLTYPGIFLLWLHCHPSYCGHQSAYPSHLGDMASKRILLDRGIFPLDLWQARRHVRRISCLRRRHDMAYGLEFDCRVLCQ